MRHRAISRRQPLLKMAFLLFLRQGRKAARSFRHLARVMSIFQVSVLPLLHRQHRYVLPAHGIPVYAHGAIAAERGIMRLVPIGGLEVKHGVHVSYNVQEAIPEVV